MRRVSQEELNKLLSEHDEFIASNGKSGHYAYLANCDLSGLKFCGHNLQYLDFYDSNLENADFSDCDIRNISLNFANTDGITMPDTPLQCPEFGEFVAYKKVLRGNKWLIAKLLIPADARRISGLTPICRSDKAIVVHFEEMNGKIISQRYATSWYDPSFIYRVGEEAVVDNFSENRWNDFAPGIHFYTQKKEAVLFK